MRTSASGKPCARSWREPLGSGAPVYFMRNLLGLVPRGAQPLVGAWVRTIFAQPDEEAAREQRNFTDPQSRTMVSSDKAFIQGYNAQAKVDTGSQVIVGCGLTNKAGDVGQMAPLVEEAERLTGRRPGEVLPDAGYWSGKNVQFLDQRGGRLPDPRGQGAHRMGREEEPLSLLPSAEASLRDRCATR